MQTGRSSAGSSRAGRRPRAEKEPIARNDVELLARHQFELRSRLGGIDGSGAQEQQQQLIQTFVSTFERYASLSQGAAGLVCPETAPFADLTLESAAAVALHHRRPPLPSGIPEPAAELLDGCCAESASQRPTFASAQKALSRMREELTTAQLAWLDEPNGHPVYATSLLLTNPFRRPLATHLTERPELPSLSTAPAIRASHAATPTSEGASRPRRHSWAYQRPPPTSPAAAHHDDFGDAYNAYIC